MPTLLSVVGQGIMFATVDELCFPATLGLAGQFDRLVDGNNPAIAANDRAVYESMYLANLLPLRPLPIPFPRLQWSG